MRDFNMQRHKNLKFHHCLLPGKFRGWNWFHQHHHIRRRIINNMMRVQWLVKDRTLQFGSRQGHEFLLVATTAFRPALQATE
jgi:hypothetical protein